MSTIKVPNGQLPRKQLSDQLDRFDAILDGLSEGLNGTVADAARDGIRLALKDAIVEMMTDPALRARLHQATAPEGPVDAAAEAPAGAKRPGLWARLKAGVTRTTGAAGQAAAAVASGAVAEVKGAAAAATAAVRTLRGHGRLKRLVLLGLGVGGTLAIVSYVTPPALAAGLAGLSGAVAAGSVQVGVWTRRTFRALAGA